MTVSILHGSIYISLLNNSGMCLFNSIKCQYSLTNQMIINTVNRKHTNFFVISSTKPCRYIVSRIYLQCGNVNVFHLARIISLHYRTLWNFAFAACKWTGVGIVNLKKHQNVFVTSSTKAILTKLCTYSLQYIWHKIV